MDLAEVNPAQGLYKRLLGSVAPAGSGQYGVPVVGGADLDRDGHADYAMASMVGSPQGRTRAGQVFLAFGDSTASGLRDSASPAPDILVIHGDQPYENAGSEVWMSDVNGDGHGDLLICRQNYTPDEGRLAAGALTIIFSDPALRQIAASGQVLDLRNPPEDIELFTIHGAAANNRLCIWTRNGDVTGDGIDEILLGADGATHGATHAGEAWLLRGGDWLNSSADIDLADFGSVATGKLARVRPALVNGDITAHEYHFGATVTLADLDGNNKAEMIAAAGLNRAGASLKPVGSNLHGTGGTDNGTVYIAWDDNFAGDWATAPDFVVGAGPGSWTIIDGGHNGGEDPGGFNDDFGEELLGGEDYDNDGNADLFVGDLTGDGYNNINRNNAGLGHVIYNLALYKNQYIELDSPPDGFTMATFLGAEAGGIAADTAMHGDFNNDGISDLAFSAPHDVPLGRHNAGTLYIVLGQDGPWPVFSDLLPAFFPDSDTVQIVEIYGAKGNNFGEGGSVGDTLCYSGNAADMTGDGVIDLVINEMMGDGSVLVDVGNLLILDSEVLFKGQDIIKDGFEPEAPEP